ncbi:MAG: BlaI/MecI/CopY family transcriptional regulator [Lachnospiraceae bacterium]|nr:BlaI/MecI/CopY family transcriptional regulator [Lachnospiraceae bacterium]
MQEIQLGVIEAKFADMIWEHQPITSSELVKLSAVEFNWKRTTTHTVLRRLCDKGLFRNDKGMVHTVISRQDFYAGQSRKYVDEAFHGSLPAFIAAFTKYNSLTSEEAAEIRKMIDDAEENGDG